MYDNWKFQIDVCDIIEGIWEDIKCVPEVSAVFSGIEQVIAIVFRKILLKH